MEERFRAELRRRRAERDWSPTELATKVHYSKGHISRVENGDKPPSGAFARLCDQVLEAGGAPLALAAAAQDPCPCPGPAAFGPRTPGSSSGASGSWPSWSGCSRIRSRPIRW
ncbi:multiprotein-bridging factor 1 family protein [Nonomuraea sp. NPDC050451]|uniref:multiprotein-bridging factor 1 family protein n=1 Tax=Nonomuraea sp. NPDC050451 TaxID=3364364 RepID=UPI0037956DA3